MEKKALGRGLKALIGEPEDFARYETSFSQHIFLDEIEPNPQQPRVDFDEGSLDGLVSSIKANGVLQPIIVRQAGDKYQIIAGERRWRAARRANLSSIPAIIREATDQDMLQIALIENLQRQDLNPIEEAVAYRALIDQHDMSQEALARRIGKDRSTIANTMRLLSLPQEIQGHVSRGTLSMGHARALLALGDVSAQLELCRRILEEGLSVRQVESLAKRGTRTRGQKERRVDPNVVHLEEQLQLSLGTKVRIRTSGKRGKIVLEFYSPDELEALIQRLLKQDERFS